MSSGKILAWRKNEGDVITRGDILAEVETDKANLEIEAFHQGTLLKIMAPASSTAKVGDIIAYIGDPSEKGSVGGQANGTNGNGAHTPAPVAQDPTATVPVASIPAAQPAPATQAAPAPQQTQTVDNSDRVRISPLAKKIAEQKNVDVSTLQGSGPNGRIVKKDVDALGGAQRATASSTQPTNTFAPAAPIQRSSSGEGRMLPFSRMRETIARRMQQSVNESPHFYATISINMREAKKLREILKEREDFKGISVNHLVIKASAYALQREPRVNRTVKDGQIFEPGQINIGIITAIDDGLLIPVIKETDQLSLRDIVFEAKAAVDRARAGRPNSSDLTGGTFSISNMGMFDVENFTAIINPGQGAVLAVSATSEQPVVENGVIVPGYIMKATISVDHRIIDGIMSATFLKYFKEALETPALLLL